MSEIDLDFLRACLKEAGQLAFRQRGGMVADIKADHTPVTVVDKQVEGFLIGKILERYPDHLILSEESGLNESNDHSRAEFAWVIDPIDGTRAFAAGLPIWGVSIGILKNKVPYAGGFTLPVTQETYWSDGETAYYNGKPMRRLESVDLRSPLVFLAVPSEFHHQFKVDYPRIRSLGSTAAHLAYVASGAAVGALTSVVSLWDLAGILPILRATGAELAYLSGEPFVPADVLDGRAIRKPLLAAHPSVMAELQQMIRVSNPR